MLICLGLSIESCKSVGSSLKPRLYVHGRFKHGSFLELSEIHVLVLLNKMFPLFLVVAVRTLLHMIRVAALTFHQSETASASLSQPPHFLRNVQWSGYSYHSALNIVKANIFS